MPNWCLNQLYAAGEPELVDEFRLINAQHQKKWMGFVQASPPKLPSSHLVDFRPWYNFSFHSVMPSGEWGTNFGPEGDAYAPQAMVRAPRWTLPHGESLDVCRGWEFDTAWQPADSWFQAARDRFPQLRLAMGYNEPGNGVFGVFTDDMEDDTSHERQRACLSEARRHIRAHLPAARKPPPLARAIWSDRADLVARHWDPTDAAHEFFSYWSPLLHAARAGAEHSFAAFIAGGASLAEQSAQGVGVLDLLLDVYPCQPPELIAARTRMLEQVLAVAPGLAQRPLASGVTPAELAARFRMQSMLRPLIEYGGLASRGAMGGIGEVAASFLEPEQALTIIDLLTPGESRDYAITLLAHAALRRCNIGVMLQLRERHGPLDETTLASARGLTPLRKEHEGQEDVYAHADMVAAMRAYDARRAALTAMAAAAPGATP